MEYSLGLVKQLLNQVKIITNAYEIVKKNTGEDFNLFQILGMETAEVKTHSKFLAELLNPDGSHLQGDIFLSLFINYLNEFDESNKDHKEYLFGDDKIKLIPNKAKIVIEKFIGKKTDTEGGRIDMTIEDSENRIICIENKIYAVEQDKQLLRYSNFANKYKEFHLIFLTLNGNKCSILNEDEGKVYSISYKKHIVEWLELCKKEAVSLPILRETIGQYVNLIKKLTHQTTNIKMKKDIQKLIENNIEESKLIRENYDQAVNELIIRQTKILKDLFIAKGFLESEISIERALRQNDGLYVQVKSFDETQVELGINIEILNDYFFFVVAPLNGDRNYKDCNSEKYFDIKKFLHSKINNLSIYNAWTIGKATDFAIGINKEFYFYPQSDNSKAFENLVERILNFREILNS